MTRPPPITRIVDAVPQDAVLVCAETSCFADDVACQCIACGRALVCRPHLAHVATKMCQRCAAPLAARPGVETVTTRTVAREVAGYFAKPRGRA